MPCYHPYRVFRSNRGVNPETGNWPIVFNAKDGYTDLPPIYIPCGQCIGCRLERSRVWAARCMLESAQYADNCFLTLTFDDAHLPCGDSLEKDTFVKFMKDLRYRFGSGIRYFHCGEYGDLSQRPHHHAILFNFSFPDRKLFSSNGVSNYYTSEMLNRLWPYGLTLIGDVTFESCAYVARYVCKKVTGDKSKVDAHYHGRLPEYVTMSRRPGIAQDFVRQYQDDIYNYDRVVIRESVSCLPFRYFDKQLSLTNPERYAIIKASRQAKRFNNFFSDNRKSIQDAISQYKLDGIAYSMELYSRLVDLDVNYQRLADAEKFQLAKRQFFANPKI